MKLSLVVGTVIAVSVAACGGKILDESTLGGATTDNGNGSASGSATSGGTGTPGSPTSSGGTTTPGQPGTSTPGQPAPPPASGPTGAVACGSTKCDAATQQCCLSFGGGPGGPGGADGSCVPVGKCDGELALSCSSAKNCPSGQVCCANLDQDSATATCQATCGGGGGPGGPGPGGGPDSIQLCSADSDCPKGIPCRQTPFGFGVCQPRRGGGGGPGGGGGGG